MRVLERLFALVAAAVLAVGIVPIASNGQAPLGATAVAATSIVPPVSRSAVFHDRSGPLAGMTPIRPPLGKGDLFEPKEDGGGVFGAQPADPVRQTAPSSGGAAMPAPNLVFEAQRDADNFPFLVEPPDPNMDVGPNDVVQIVNSTFAVYDKQGNLLLGPEENQTLWQDFGVGSGDPATAVCGDVSNAGDPIVQYDQLADRWLLSQFAFGGGGAGVPAGPYYECIAVSATSDPLGTWNRYEFLISATKFDDYPHIGVWPDGYYMSINQFDATTDFGYAGPGAVAFERDKMLAGQSAQMVYFDLSSGLGPQYGGQQPSDLDGKTLPPAGAPDVFAEIDDNANGFASDRLDLFNFHVDWATTANSTFSGPTAVPVASFDSGFPCQDADGDGAARNCIPERTGPGLDVISDRLMFRLAYRRFADHETLTVDHTVDVNNPEGHAGIRWYELRKSGTSGWGVYQQGTYAPDARHRWMGSTAMDKAGDLAVGYSLSSSTMNPAIAYAGRLVGDPLGQLGQGEVVMYQGTGSRIEQVDPVTGPGEAGRWGDYTSLVLDPTNDCTFWYTNEYYETDGAFDWHTKIGSFTFPSCLGSGADMGVTTTATPPPVRVGQTITYTLSIANNGPDSTSGAQVVDTLPSQVSLLGVTTTLGKCSGTNPVTCKLGTMARGKLATVTITVRAPSTPATLTNQATVSSVKKDPNPANNTSTTILAAVDACTPPGVLVAVDASDAAPNTSPVPQTDLRNLWVGEPHQADGVARLVFTVSLGGGGTLPPSSQWYVIWNRPVADSTYDRNYVAMKTDAAGTPSFEYGSVSPANANLPTKRGTATGSYDAVAGTFTVAVPTSAVDNVGPGSALGALEARAFLARVDGQPVTELQSTDFGPATIYRMVGNC